MFACNGGNARHCSAGVNGSSNFLSLFLLSFCSFRNVDSENLLLPSCQHQHSTDFRGSVSKEVVNSQPVSVELAQFLLCWITSQQISHRFDQVWPRLSHEYKQDWTKHHNLTPGWQLHWLFAPESRKYIPKYIILCVLSRAKKSVELGPCLTATIFQPDLLGHGHGRRGQYVS